jgi:hypothetical protein
MLFKWYKNEFGKTTREILNWVVMFLPDDKEAKLRELLFQNTGDDAITITYKYNSFLECFATCRKRMLSNINVKRTRYIDCDYCRCRKQPWESSGVSETDELSVDEGNDVTNAATSEKSEIDKFEGKEEETTGSNNFQNFVIQYFSIY